jgi:hypothetical protein
VRFLHSEGDLLTRAKFRFQLDAALAALGSKSGDAAQVPELPLRWVASRLSMYGNAVSYRVVPYWF